jgi:ABC-type multidrug transport system fused ATPase/permease subunit
MIKDINKITQILKYFATKYRFYLILLSLVLLLEAFVGLILVFSIAPIADYLFDNTLVDPNRITKFLLTFYYYYDIKINFWSLSIFFITANFAKAGVDILTRYVCYKIKYRVYEKVSTETLETILNANWSFFNQTNHGKLLNSLQKESGNISETLSQIAYQISFLAQLVIYFSIPLWLNMEITITAILFAFIFIFPFFFTNKISFKLGKKNTSTANIMIDRLSEILMNCKLIISHNMQIDSIKKYNKSIHTHANAAIKSQLFINSCSTLFQPFSYLATIIAIGYGLSINISLTETAAVLWGLMRAMPIFSKILQNNLNISSCIPSFEQIDQIKKAAEQTYFKNDGIVLKEITKSIDFDKVNFSYSKRKKHFSNFSLSIQSKKITAIVGQSGSGKTTLVDLILGIHSPTSGEIKFDGIPMKNLNIKKIRNLIGYVPQEPQLFNASIKNNLIWLNKQVSTQDITSACEMANIFNFVNQLPNGLNTDVGDIGNNLSGGQKQRITIARAILRKPSLLIFDEATSSLDTISENLILKSLNKISKKSTVIIIAHRIKTLKEADKIIVLKNGEIVGQDTYQNLVKKKNITFLKLLNKITA